MELEFYKWLDEALEEFCRERYIRPGEVLPTINITKAKLSFIKGISAKEYLKTV